MLMDGFLAPGTLIRYRGLSRCIGDAATYLTIISGLGVPPTDNLRA